MFSMTDLTKTPFPLVASITVTLTTPELSIMAMPQQSSPSVIAPPPLEIDFKDEFIEELIEGFNTGLKRCLSMIFKSTRTSFASWRPIFFRAIESIRDVRGAIEAKSLEELINNLEKDISEWSYLRQQDVTPMVETNWNVSRNKCKGTI